MTTARELVDQEREDQIVAGYDATHDDQHTPGLLARMGACYADHAANQFENIDADIPHPFWPGDESDWNPGDSDVERLAKAAALLEAELDRLLREMNTGSVDA